MYMKRLTETALELIKSSDKSYSKILKELDHKFGIKTYKSVISYYKRSRPRIKPIDLSTVSEWELEWLFGLYFADGCKFIDKHCYIIKFSLDYIRDKDIAERVIELLKRVGLHPLLSRDKGSLVIRVCSKILYSIFPSKSEVYKPKDIFAFLSGLIDGDGYAIRSQAYISQDSHEDLMSYLTDELKLTKYFYYRPDWSGLRKRGTMYYVRKKIGQILIERNYCIKLLRQLN